MSTAGAAILIYMYLDAVALQVDRRFRDPAGAGLVDVPDDPPYVNSRSTNPYVNSGSTDPYVNSRSTDPYVNSRGRSRRRTCCSCARR